MESKSPRKSPKYMTMPFDIVVTKMVTVGHVTEDPNSRMSPVEAAMNLIAKDIDATNAAREGGFKNTDNYEFRVADTKFMFEATVITDDHPDFS